MDMQKTLLRLAVGALLLGTSTSWAAGSRLVVVHEGGRSTTTTLQDDMRYPAKVGKAICDTDPSVAFAFTEKVSLNAIQSPGAIVIKRVDVPADLQVEAAIVCSNIEGSLSLNFDLGGAPSPTAGFSVSPSAQLALSLPLQAGLNALESKRWTIGVTNTSRVDDESFDIRRVGGSFNGLLGGVDPVVGALSPSVLSRVTLTGPTVPDTVPDTVGNPQDDPFIAEVYQDVVKDFCVEGNASSTDACRSLANLATAAQNDAEAAQQLTNALRAIAPEKAAVISTNGTQIVAGQVGNVAMRIASLLSGNAGGFSTTGLTVAEGKMPVSLSFLGDAVSSAVEGSDNEALRTLLAGTRWGIWVNGTFGGGDYERLRGNEGFDFENWSVTSGVDYRFTDQAFLGGALGLSKLSSDFEDEQGSLDAKSIAFHAYGGYSPSDTISLDGSVSWVNTDYDMTRLIPGDDATVIDSLALGRPDSSQVSGAFGMSWNLQRNAWTFAPTAQFQFLSTDIDPFSEQSDSLFRLRYAEQHIVTRSLSAGIYTDYTSATGVGAFRPYGRLLWYADSGTGSRNLVANFINDGTVVDGVKIAEPDRRYVTAELGLNFRRPIGTRTVDFNVGVLGVFGFEALDRWAVRADVRLPF